MRVCDTHTLFLHISIYICCLWCYAAAYLWSTLSQRKSSEPWPSSYYSWAIYLLSYTRKNLNGAFLHFDDALVSLAALQCLLWDSLCKYLLPLALSGRNIVREQVSQVRGVSKQAADMQEPTEFGWFGGQTRRDAWLKSGHSSTHKAFLEWSSQESVWLSWKMHPLTSELRGPLWFNLQHI